MQIFAHRGASGEYPENTLLAFEQALQQQADGIELDIQLVEGHALVFHDRHLQRCTNGHGPLASHSLSQLRRLDAGRGEQIPLLIEVLELVAGRCLLNIEIKQLAAAQTTLQLLRQEMQRTGFSPEQLLISSFDHRILAEFASRYAEFPFAAITASVPHQLAAFVAQLPCRAIHADIDSYSQAFAEDAARRGFSFRVYTVDQEQEMLAMQRNGVDAIFTNYPARAKALLT